MNIAEQREKSTNNSFEWMQFWLLCIVVTCLFHVVSIFAQGSFVTKAKAEPETISSHDIYLREREIRALEEISHSLKTISSRPACR